MVEPREGLGDRGVETRAGLAEHLAHGGLDRPRVLVGTPVRERVEDVGDSDDAAGQRDRRGREPVRIAAAVPALVVGERDLLGHHQQLVGAAREDPRADRRVQLHRRELLGRVLAGLQQQVVGDADLADVVQPRRVADERRLGWIHAELEREQLARPADPVGVLPGRVVAVLGREREAVEHLELRVLELARALHYALVQEVVGALELDAQVARLQEVAHAQQHLGHVDRLGQEIACAERQRAAFRVGRDVGGEHEHRHPVGLLGEEDDVLEDLRTAASRHVPVQQHQVGRLLAAVPDDLQRVGHHLDPCVSRAREDRLQEQGVRLLVIDHEDLRRKEQLVIHCSTPPLSRVRRDRLHVSGIGHLSGRSSTRTCIRVERAVRRGR